MKLKFNRIIFCDISSKKILTDIQQENEYTKYYIRNISDFETSKYNWNYDLSIDKEIKKGINHTVDLYKIWNEKIYFLNICINDNIFNSDYFIWLDIGSFRYKDRLKDFINFPQSNNMISDKVLMFQMKSFSKQDKLDIKYDDRFEDTYRIGGMFGGDKKSLIEFKNKYTDILKQFKKKKIFAGKDQNLYNFLVIENKHLIDLKNAVKLNKKYKYNEWFILHYYLS